MTQRRGESPEFAPLPEGWDGKAATRIVDVLERDLVPAALPALQVAD